MQIFSPTISGSTDVQGPLTHTGSLTSTLDIANASLWVDYIFLDTDERRRYAQLSHEYLIEQLQFTGDESVNSSVNNIRLNFNHPVKELVWVVQQNSLLTKDWTNFSSSSASPSSTANEFYNEYTAASPPTGYINPVYSAQLKLNGQDRFRGDPWLKGQCFRWA